MISILLRKRVEKDLMHNLEARVSFELVRRYGVSKLGPILYKEDTNRLEELLGKDKHFRLDNDYAMLVVKYKDDSI